MTKDKKPTNSPEKDVHGQHEKHLHKLPRKILTMPKPPKK